MLSPDDLKLALQQDGLSRADRILLETLAETAESQLDANAFAAAFTAGKVMSVEQVIAYAAASPLEKVEIGL